MHIKPSLHLNFSDFWPGFDKTDNFFFNLLSEKYEVRISTHPDILFYSVYGNEHIKFNCTKVLYTGENIRPDFKLCDFAFSFDYPVTDRNYRLPLYALYGDVQDLVGRKINEEEQLGQKKKFCCFVISNDKCTIRNDFFEALSKYKKVDSGGRAMNNIGGAVVNKLDFIKDYKFVIAFENSAHPGYTTEKIFEPLSQNCIPIYWGDPLISNDFNVKRFVHCKGYADFDSVIEQIIAIDKDDSLLLQYLNEPAFPNDQVNEFVEKENIVTRLDEIVAFHYRKKIRIWPYLRPVYFYLKVGYQYGMSGELTPRKLARQILKWTKIR